MHSQRAPKYDKLTSRRTKNTPLNLAEEEFDRYQDYMHSQYQPQMQPSLVLGAFDENRDPQHPIFGIGPMTKPGYEFA